MIGDKSLKEQYREYYKHRRRVGCRPLNYFQWLDWKEKERRQKMKD